MVQITGSAKPFIVAVCDFALITDQIQAIVRLIVFAGGIGENVPLIRKEICDNLSYLGLKVDQKSNKKNLLTISDPSSKDKVYVKKTNEEYLIAQFETFDVNTFIDYSSEISNITGITNPARTEETTSFTNNKWEIKEAYQTYDEVGTMFETVNLVMSAVSSVLTKGKGVDTPLPNYSEIGSLTKTILTGYPKSKDYQEVWTPANFDKNPLKKKIMHIKLTNEYLKRSERLNIPSYW